MKNPYAYDVIRLTLSVPGYDKAVSIANIPMDIDEFLRDKRLVGNTMKELTEQISKLAFKMKKHKLAVAK